MSKDRSEFENLWRQYTLLVDLYKFYWEIAIKINTFYYAVTGAIVAYYFQNTKNGFSWMGLLLPIFFSLAIGVISFYGATLLGIIRTDVFEIRNSLNLETAPEMQVLVVFLRVSGLIAIFTGIVLGFFVYKALTA